MNPFHRIGSLLPALALCLACALPALAQNTPAVPADATGESTAAAPASLSDDLDMPLEQFRLRLIPLTVDQLGILADQWLGIVQNETQAVVEQQIELNAAGTPAPQDLVNQLTKLRETRSKHFEKFMAVVDNFTQKGGAADKAATYRAYRNAVALDEAQLADLQTLLHRAGNWLTSRTGGVKLAISLGTIVASIIALTLLARVLRMLAGRWIMRIPKASRLFQVFLKLAVYWITIVLGLLFVISALGVDLTPIFALVGGASFIMAFSLQETLSNLAAGLMIIMNRPFDEGDYVDIAGTAGTVRSVSIVSTKVTTPDNQVIIVPNSKVWGNIITNVTASRTRRVDLVFSIGYGDSIEEAQRVLDETVRAHPLVLPDPEPVIRVSALGASSVDFICRPWVKSPDYWGVYWDLTRQVKEAFDAAGISIPFPQTDMHIHMPHDAPTPVIMAATANPQHPPTSPVSEPTPGTTLAERYAAGDDGPGDDGNER